MENVMAYQLISFVLCPYVQRSVITLKEKQVPFEITYIDLQNPLEWFPAISPMGKVPVLRVDEDRVLFESAVINEYLDETNPPPLHPQDPWRRAHNRAWIEFGSNLIGRQYQMLMAPDEGGFVQERDGLLADLRYVEQQLGEGPFFNGAAFSLADTAYAPLFVHMDLIERRHPLGLFAQTPKVGTWRDALLARPTVRESVVADFGERFSAYFAAQGGYLGKRLA
ncbi:MAG: glutathione S-transferase family protein [Chromatiales bacterium]|nr:glutathione S-transferase family protein [Chromatiales bacterium]